jgi:hypothetical protein
MRLVAFTAALCLVARGPEGADAALVFSAGFSDDMVIQRSTSEGGVVYGFTDSTLAVKVDVSGTESGGKSVSYTADATVAPWAGGADIHPNTPPAPPHGNFVWRAVLQPGANTLSSSVESPSSAWQISSSPAVGVHGNVDYPPPSHALYSLACTRAHVHAHRCWWWSNLHHRQQRWSQWDRFH